ncbi:MULTISPECIES: PH domain-containing protein [Streptomyces]|uniref:PH domain-containing protein n=1 Tax=Streptomyces lycii TaxID=2654337 RepID=A0ABQ7FFA0_9ACTN|nr:PH domain-containing protein [Streptomyces lycii]KAF4407305.1 PH domain-containing protein [Streptomyces lycii]
MTSPDDSTPPQPGPESESGSGPVYADRVYRSGSAIAGGVLLLALAAWLGLDALIRGEDRTPWYALAGLLCAVPLIIAFTLRPAVFANAERLRVRNPFRTITLPWASVEGVRAGYSSEVFAAGGGKYQLWAVPVSLRARKKASRRAARAAADDPHGNTSPHAGVAGGDRRAAADQAIDELQELAERQASNEAARGEPEVRWAFEVLAPSAVGAVLILVLSLLG